MNINLVPQWQADPPASRAHALRRRGVQRRGRRTQQGYSPGSRRRAPHRLAGVAAILTVARTVTRQLIYQVSSVLCCRRGMNGNSPHLLPSYLCSHSSCACVYTFPFVGPLYSAEQHLFRDIIGPMPNNYHFSFATVKYYSVL